MSQSSDHVHRSRLRVLDRPVEPDPDFARQLEGELFGRSDAPVAPDRARPVGPRRRWLAMATAAVALVGGVVLYLAAGDEPGRTATVPGPTQPAAEDRPTTTIATTTVSTNSAATERATVEGRPARTTQTQFSGRLPDGTGYQLVVEPGMTPGVRGVSAGIVVDLADGSAPAIGVVDFQQVAGEPSTPAQLEDSTYLAVSGGWRLRISLHDQVLDALGREYGDVDELILDSIVPTPGGTLPAVRLEAPFRWAEDDELPLEVAYTDVVVRRGCGRQAVACGVRQGVQVIPADVVFSGAPTWDGRDVWIESQALRPPSVESWLDPGPLQPRGGHQVLWTGREMIVWGGATGDRPAHLVDGAAFDPATDRWRILAPAPIEAPATTVALWAGTEMLVLSIDATLAYDPDADSWEVAGDGIVPGKPIWDGSSVVTVSRDGVHRFDRDRGRWIELPGAVITGGAAEAFDYFRGEELRSLGGVLYLRRGCSTHMQRWTGEAWEAVDRVPDAIGRSTPFSFCPWANQWSVAGDRLLIWESSDHPTVAFDPASGEWLGVERIPVPGTEGARGAILLGERVLAVNWLAAIYDPATGTWTEVELPGAASEADMVWTGREVLMWGGTCCYGSSDPTFTVDAWRWTPTD